MIPTPGHVIVKREEKQQKSAGGIVLANVETEIPSRGIVKAVTRDFSPLHVDESVQVGSDVIFVRNAGQKFKTDAGEELLILRIEDILVVL